MTDHPNRDERTALRFEAIKVNFDWTNEDWALTWLPPVRMAAVLIAHDDKEHEGSLAALVKDGAVPEMLNGLCETKEHLLALASMIDAALLRTYAVLERLGYSPDNPP